MKFLDTLAERPGRTALAVIAITTLLRLYFVASGQVTLVQDEAQYWDWTRHLQLSYYSKGPGIAWIIHFWTNIFGDTELGVRFGSIFGAALLQGLFYLGLARLAGRPTLALVTLFVVNTIVLFNGLAILMTTDNPLIFFWTGAMFSIYAACTPTRDGRERNWPYITLGLCLGLGILAKYIMLMLIPVLVIVTPMLMRKGLAPRRFALKVAGAVGLGMIIGFLPVLIWNLQNDFVGFKHVAHLTGASGAKAKQFFRLHRMPDYVLSQIGLITPWWLAFMLIGSVQAIRRVFVRKEEQPDQGTLLDIVTLTFFLPYWTFVLLWSLHVKVHPNWPAMCYTAGAVIAARSFLDLWRNGSEFWFRLRKVWPVLATLFFLLIYSFHALPIPNDYDPTRRVKGWRDLGLIIEGYRTAKFKDADRVFIMSNLYDMTAALAFYVPGQPRTYCGWVDSRRMNQYDLWPGPVDKTGWDAIYVYKEYDNQPAEDVQKMFERTSPPIYVQTKHNGADARKFTLFLCYGYNGYWPDRFGDSF